MDCFKIGLFLLLILFEGCSSEPSRKISPLIEKEIKTDTIFAFRVDTVRIPFGLSEKDDYFIYERLPFWVIQSKIIKDNVIQDIYKIDVRLNPFYLEDDFNGDGVFDVALPIINSNTEEKGFAILHGNSFDTHIIGAGTILEDMWESSDLSWFNIWLINRNKINPPGVDIPDTLFLKNPSIQIEKSEVGGGQIYWNGKSYAYFHQTC